MMEGIIAPPPCPKPVKITDLSLQELAHIASYIANFHSPPCAPPALPASPPTSSLPKALLAFAQASPLFAEAVAVSLRHHVQHLTPRGEGAAFSEWLHILGHHVHTVSHVGSDKEALKNLCVFKPPAIRLRALDMSDIRNARSHLITDVLNVHGPTLEALALPLGATTSVENTQTTMPRLRKFHVRARRERRLCQSVSNIASALLKAILSCAHASSLTHLSFDGFHEGVVADVAFCDDLASLFSSVVHLKISMAISASHRSYHATAHFISLFRLLRTLSFTGNEFCAHDTTKIINSCSSLSDVHMTLSLALRCARSEPYSPPLALDMFRLFGASLKSVNIMNMSDARFLESLLGTASYLQELRVAHPREYIDWLLLIVEECAHLKVLHIRMGGSWKESQAMLGADKWLRLASAIEGHNVTLQQLSVLSDCRAFHDSSSQRMSEEEEAALLSCFQRVICHCGPTLTLLEFEISVGRGSFARSAEATVSLLTAASKSCIKLHELVLRLNSPQNYFGSHLRREEFARFLLMSLQTNTKRLLSKSRHLWRLDLDYLPEAARSMMGEEEQTFHLEF